MSMKHEARLGLAVHWIQQALMTAYEDNCSHRLTRGRKSLKWKSELKSLRKEFRQLFNRWRENDKPSSWELYRDGDIGTRYVRLPKKSEGLSEAL